MPQVSSGWKGHVPLELRAKKNRPQRGDHAFLTKLGNQGRGIFTSGWITKGSHERPESDFGRGVVIEFDAFLDPGAPRRRLDPSVISGQHWPPENSGAEIKAAAYG